MKKNTKITILVILGIFLLIGGIFLLKEVQKKEAEAYVLQETKIGLKGYFKTYFNNVNANDISLRIHYIHGMGVEAKVDGTLGKNKKVTDDNSDFSWTIYNDPKSKIGFTLGYISPSEKLEKKLKWEYDNDDNPHAKDWSNMKSPTEFIPKKDLNQIPKSKKRLINYIPGTESF